MPPRASPRRRPPSTSTGRPSSARRARDVAGVRRAGGSPSTRRPRPAGPAARRGRAARGAARSPARRLPKRNPAPATTSSAPIAEQVLLARTPRARAPATSGRELDDERVLHSELGEQLEPALERRQSSSTLFAEHLARVRVERDHGRREPAAASTAAPHDGAMTEMDAVERPDRDRPRPARRALRRARSDVHAAASSVAARPARAHRARIASGTRSSASAGERGRAPRAAGSKHGVVDRVGLLDPERPDRGPPQRRAVPAERRGDRPDVRARADVQRRAARSSPVYAMTSSAYTCERRRGISTATPRRASR